MARVGSSCMGKDRGIEGRLWMAKIGCGCMGKDTRNRGMIKEG